MKLLTLNCHSWQEENQMEKIKYLAMVIREKQYDVIALQEVSQRIESKLVKNNVKEDNFAYVLTRELEKLGVHEYSFVWDFSHIGYDIYEEGLAILTKHKINEFESFYISKSDDISYYKTRKIIKVAIDVNSEESDFYSCHLGWWHDAEEPFSYQADKLIGSMKNNRKTIIMGDFNNNAFIRDEGYDYLLNKGLKDTYFLAKEKDSGITVKGEIAGWENCIEQKRLDLILSNYNAKVISSYVIFNNERESAISDHFGVEVQLRL